MSSFSYGSARVSGMSHRNENKPCQDSIMITRLNKDDEEYLILAVADGHGHFTHDLSAIGSKVATTVATEVVAKGIERWGRKYIDGFNGTFAEEVCHEWSRGILEDSISRGVSFDPVRYGTTLTVAVMCEATIVIGKIGDGTVAVRTGDTSIVLWYEEEQARSNRTHSMCQVDAISWFSFQRIDDCGGVLLATDGLVNSLTSFKDLETILDYFMCQLESEKLSTGIDRSVMGLAEQCAVNGACDDTTIAVAARIL